MAARRASKAPVAKERVSLNPEREKADSVHCEKLLGDDKTRETLEAAWRCVLSSGDALRNEKCTFALYKKALIPPESTFGDTDRNMSIIFRAFDSQHLGDELIDFIGYVKSLFHLGFERFKSTDYDVVTQRMLTEFILPYIAYVRRLNDVGPLTPDARLIEDVDVDRVLYIYDGVADRLFNRYRAADDHENRDLTLEQCNILDQFVETMEVREFAKDYGFFPRHLSWVEISASAQMSCFGKIVRDPSIVGPSYQSRVDGSVNPKAARDRTVALMSVPEPVATPITTNNTTAWASDITIDRSVSNPLFAPALPSEYLTDEPLLDKPRFMSCLVRIAQALYNKSDFVQRLPTVASRLEEMLAHMAPIYERAFGRSMESDCDFTERGVPTLLASSPTASLSPTTVTMEGGVDLQIQGNGFGEKRGVFVRFSDKVNNTSVLVRSHEVTKRRVTVRVPPAVPQDVGIELSFSKGLYNIAVSRIAKIVIECSNDKTTFSQSDPMQILTYREPLPVYAMPEVTATRLVKSFVVLCAIGHPYNNKYLPLDNWHRAKNLFGVAEAASAPPVGTPSSFATTPALTHKTENDTLSVAIPTSAESETLVRGNSGRDPYFLLFAQVHEGAPGLSLDFKGYLSALSRCFLASHGAELWHTEFDRISMIEVNAKQHANKPRIENAVTEVLDERALVDAAIAATEKRTIREVDIYLGPVLCGKLTDQVGSLRSMADGELTAVFPHHPTLDYLHYDDVSSEGTVMGHLMAAKSFNHALDRLISHGFDAACHVSDRRTRKPVGRCWAIIDPHAVSNEGGTARRVGAMWDYQGHFSNLEWQPAAHALKSPSVTLSCYCSDRSDTFRQLYLAFIKGHGPGDVRGLITAKGFKMSTTLYKVP